MGLWLGSLYLNIVEDGDEKNVSKTLQRGQIFFLYFRISE